MGSSESTARSNQTNEEEERKPENNSSGGPSSGGPSLSGVETAIAVAAGAATVAYGISRMLSARTNSEDQENDDRMKIKAPGTMAPYNFPESGTYGPGAPISWSPPPFGRYKMNTDGGACPNPGPSGYGGILRDHHGDWIRGFRGFIGHGDGLTAEFHGILKGLELLDKLGLKESILESDSTAAVDWIKKAEAPYLRHSEIITSCWGIIIECRRLVRKNNITIMHVSEDFNKCADKLATMAIKNKEEYMEIMELPFELENLVKADQSRVVYGSPSSSGRYLL